MSEEVNAEGASQPLPELDLKVRRVLGVLVEKAKTTPDAYPLSLNALVTGSNQKSNRDPVLDLKEEDVDEALVWSKNHGLVTKVIGGRVDRWRHLLYEAWNVNKVELAILGELLLRGPQTEGELRTRASRMEPIEGLDELRSVLKPMTERKLVVYLTDEDRRGAVLTHGFHHAGELGQLKARARSAQQASPSSTGEGRVGGGSGSASIAGSHSHGPGAEQWQSAMKRMESMEEKIASLSSKLAQIEEELARLKPSPGG